MGGAGGDTGGMGGSIIGWHAQSHVCLVKHPPAQFPVVPYGFEVSSQPQP